MQHLLLMCGPAFSGKTVVSTAIQRELGCVRVSLDEVNAERGLPPGGEGLPPEAWEASGRVAADRVRQALTAGHHVVLDDTCCFRFLRDRYRAVADGLGVPTLVLYLDVPVAELERRRAASRAQCDRPDVVDAVFRSHLETFEHPDADEDVTVFRPADETVDAFVARVVERCRSDG
jgi:predicted kinase